MISFIHWKTHKFSTKGPLTLIINITPFFLDEDIKLNSTVFHWPDHINTVFELSQTRMFNRREHAEDELKKKIKAYDEKLNEYNKEVESFRKKEVSFHEIRWTISVASFI